MTDAADGTGAGLQAFLAWAGERGELPLATAKNLAGASGRVLSIEPDPDAVDLTRIDPEDVFNRFETLNRLNFTSDSIVTYRSRFLRAIGMYKAWLDKRPDWKGANVRQPGKAVAVRTSGNGKSATTSRTRRASDTSSRQASEPTVEQPPSSPSSPMVPYDLPLRPGLRVRLVLPEILTQADAARIAAFVASLAFDQAEISEEGA